MPLIKARSTGDAQGWEGDACEFGSSWAVSESPLSRDARHGRVRASRRQGRNKTSRRGDGEHDEASKSNETRHAPYGRAKPCGPPAVTIRPIRSLAVPVVMPCMPSLAVPVVMPCMPSLAVPAHQQRHLGMSTASRVACLHHSQSLRISRAMVARLRD